MLLGRWEGNTLIVDVANNNDQTWFDVVGDFHSDALHVQERFTPVDADTIAYEAVMTDPKVYTRPWTMALRLLRMKDYGSELWERGVPREQHAHPGADVKQTRTIARGRTPERRR